MSGNPPVDVQQYGQSIWYDNIRRSLIVGGELKRLIEEDGIMGVTSNPTIFQRAIGGSNDYDAAFADLLDQDANTIYERLAIADIQAAADILRPVYERTNGVDGYVSLEVSPFLAHDTATTVAEAKRLFAAVDRPNVMIKIPATPEGIPAIEETIAAGINVNVTLIFSVENYQQVMEAYIRGLERRLEHGEDVTRIASVASFFLSRIDTAVDRILDNNIRAAQGRDLDRVTASNQLKGKAAIANAKVAYRRFLDVFYGPRFQKLRDAGARVQRILWASTGTKNNAYPDTMYVDNLIGNDSVNTMPPETLAAFKDHGTAAETLTQGLTEAQQTLNDLARVGVDLKAITDQLQIDGVEAFAESFRSLLDQVEAKRIVLKTGIMERMQVMIGVHHDEVKRLIKDLEAAHISERIWEHDGTVWKDNPGIVAKINERLGWLDTRRTIDRERLHALKALATSGEFRDLVLLGMGGSSLAPEVLHKTFGTASGYLNFYMLDSTDPAYISALEAQIDLPRTLFIVASKSGGTIETASFMEYFYERAGRNGAQFIAITDAGSGLEAQARERGFRDIFLNPADIGGRYSALSYFGLVPAALIGLDLDRLLASADTMMDACGPKIPALHNPGIVLGVILGLLGQKGKDKVSIHCSRSIATLGNWIEQLIAESTGKEGKGLLPVVGATVGKPHDYSTDRLFVAIRVEGDDNSALDSGIEMLQAAGHPVVIITIPDAYAIGGEFFRWELATAIAGRVLGINPFDEPNVTESKQNTGRLLDYYKEHGRLPETTPLLSEGKISLYADERMAQMLTQLATQHHFDAGTIAGLLAAQFNATNAGDYFAILAYLPMTEEVSAQLNEVRRRLRHMSKRAVTIGYGPRFQHSTGQLHKGGPNNGIFIQITCDDPLDLPIPGQPYSFGVLKAAQAGGDLEALQSKGRRALRLHVDKDLLAGLKILLDAVALAAERKQ
ncbi:MAG: bifunctional transaldolase/phosoglucose isomerase [Candidatus Flexifilum sp.]